MSSVIRYLLIITLFISIPLLTSCVDRKRYVLSEKTVTADIKPSKSAKVKEVKKELVFNPTLIKTINTPDGIISVSFSPDGKYIVSGSIDKTIKVWKTDGTLVKTFEGHSGWVKIIVFNSDDN